MSKNRKILVLPQNLSIENVSACFAEIRKNSPQKPLVIDFKNVEESDYSGLAFLNYLKTHHQAVHFANVPERVARLLSEFSTESGRSEVLETVSPRPTRFEALADRFLEQKENVKRFFVLLADEAYHTLQFLRKRKGVYPGEISSQLFFMGYRSFPIVALITFLVGVTISLTSAAQLKLFGADIYLSWFVGIAMVRELVPLMVGIILAGKVGASITAEIATMQVLEEIDAIKTMGIVPEKFLMVPRLIAITLAVPLLVAIADFVGIFGGILVARFFLGTPPVVFLREMFNIVFLQDFLIGLIKTMVFGWAVVISSGFKGFYVKRSAEEVGKATTESVVLSIALIILLDCVFALFLYR